MINHDFHFFTFFALRTNNYERILLMLNNCEHSIAKSQIGQQTNHEEMASYMSLYKKIEEDIVDSQRRISELRNDLVKAIVGRKNKQEYDLLAKIIKEHPDRRETLAKLNQLEQEIHGLQGLKDELIKRLEARSREFHVFMNSAYELQYLQSQEEDANFDNRIEQIIRPKPDEI